MKKKRKYDVTIQTFSGPFRTEAKNKEEAVIKVKKMLDDRSVVWIGPVQEVESGNRKD